MAIEIVDFPIKNGGSFQFAMLNYQRVWSFFAWKMGNMDGLEMGVFEDVCHTSNNIWNM